MTADPFALLPPWSRDQEKKMIRNGIQDFEGDHVPVVRLYDPEGPAYWILTAQSPRNPLLYWGIADLGHGPEMGPIDYRDVRTINGGQGAQVDTTFAPGDTTIFALLDELRRTRR